MSMTWQAKVIYALPRAAAHGELRDPDHVGVRHVLPLAPPVLQPRHHPPARIHKRRTDG